jgi:hypothetical protein
MENNEVNPEDLLSPELLAQVKAKKQHETKMDIEDNEFMELKQIPSNFLTYDVQSVFVRGLKLGEVKMLNRTTDKKSIVYLMKIYKNAITGIDLGMLLPVDFKFLMFISAQLTDEDFSLQLETTCPNIVDGEEGNKVCNNRILSSIRVENLDWDELFVKEKTIEYKNNTLTFSPLTLNDYIFLEDIMKKENAKPEEDRLDIELISLTLMLDKTISLTKNYDLLEQKYSIFSDLPYKYMKILLGILDEFTLDIKPLQLECKKCKHKFESNIKIDFSKVFL